MNSSRTEILGDMIATPTAPSFQIQFSADKAELLAETGYTCLRLPLPLLGGGCDEGIGESPAVVRWDGSCLLAEEEDRLIGAVLVSANSRLEEATERAYRRLLEITQGWHLYRIWNYLPQINQICGGLERYRQFNIGRWAAFESKFGRDLRSFMPAASAVGIQGDQMALVFKAGRTRPQYFENPAQVPAYHYPAEYGPKPPGFARGVAISRHHSKSSYLSGTASIEGHASVGEGELDTQFRTTMHNIDIMLARMDVEHALKPALWRDGNIHEARFRCYLRDPSLLDQVRCWIREACETDAHFTYVQADICRPELDLEIEGWIGSQPTCAAHES